MKKSGKKLKSYNLLKKNIQLITGDRRLENAILMTYKSNAQIT